MNKEAIELQDFLDFLDAAYAATSQKEFYHSSSEQRVSLSFFHFYMVYSDRIRYARFLSMGINDHNKQNIIFNLLLTGKETPSSFKVEENNLIAKTLSQLPPQRVYNLFFKIKKAKINNRRTRAFAKQFLSTRDLSFDAVKYKKKLKKLASHNHLKLEDEMSSFLYKFKSSNQFETELFENFRQAYYSQAAVYSLPFTVAEGFAEKHGIERSVFLEKIEPMMTKAEKAKYLNSARKHKVQLSSDLSNLSTTKLFSFYLSLAGMEQNEMREDFVRALSKASARENKFSKIDFSKTALIIDDSFSMSGSLAKKNRPLSVSLAVSSILSTADERLKKYFLSGAKDEFSSRANGATSIAVNVISALEDGAKEIIILSDGYENAPYGGVEQVVKMWRKIEKGKRVSFIHINPVFNSGDYKIQHLSDLITCCGIRDASEIEQVLTFCRFKATVKKLSEVDNYQTKMVKRYLNEK